MFVGAALDSCLALRPVHLVVDLTGPRFCSARGMALLADTSRAATSAGIGYSLAGCRTSLERVLILLWGSARVPRRYHDTAEAIAEAVTRPVSVPPTGLRLISGPQDE